MTDSMRDGTLVLDSPTHRVRVVGTQSYQDAVWRVVGPPQPDRDDAAGRARWHGHVTLHAERHNPHDHNAVRVVVDDETVGYLPRDVAAYAQPALIALARRGVNVRVAAYAKGGFEWRSGEQAGQRASAGLTLRLDPDELRAAAGAAGADGPSPGASARAA